MKKIFTLVLLATVGGTLASHAIIAKRGIHQLPQPDGTVVNARIVGDEFSHYYLSEDNLPMLDDNQGFMRYATLDKDGQVVLSDFRANTLQRSSQAAEFVGQVDLNAFGEAVENMQVRTSGPSRKIAQTGMGRFSTHFPNTGNIKGLVILVEYSDVKFETPNAQQYFHNLLNQPGFSSHGGTGSARDYFIDNSNGQFIPQFDVYGPVTLPENQAYYGGNVNGSDKAPEMMAIHAAEILDATVDFTEYDMDKDGYVDNVYIYYAGKGEAGGGGANTVWPHNWHIEYSGRELPVHDGVKLNCYACSNEIESNLPDGIGTFVHEFSHVMGLPDLYHTSNDYATYTPGEYSVLDYGPYNNNGRTPPNYSIYERNAMGWAEPIVLNSPCSITLEHIADSNTGCIINTEKDSEFYLLENRQLKGWDAYLPGHGMLIWHVDFVQSVWDNNVVNNTSSHQYVDIVEAGGRTGTTASVQSSYTWPGTYGKREFTSSTSPALKSWAGKAIDVPITSIVETPDGTITFDVCGGAFDLGTPTGLKAEGKNNGSALLSWSAVDRATGYYLTLSRDGGVLPAFDHINVGNVTSVTLQGLPGGCTLTASVSACAGLLEGETVSTTFAMPVLDFVYETPVFGNYESNQSDGFTLNWNAVPGAVDYLLTINGNSINSTKSQDSLDFGSGSTLSIPSGWTCSVDNPDKYTSKFYYGNSAPSLKLQYDGTTLTSPVYPGNIESLSFWARGASTDSKTSLEIQARADEDSEWQTVHTVLPLNATKGETITVNDFPEGMQQVRFVFHKSVGNCPLDDVCVTYSPIKQVAHPEYTSRSVGNVTSHKVTTLLDGITDYTATLVAVDGQGRKSQTSEPLSIKRPTGVDNIAVCPAAGSFSLSGRSLTYKGIAGAQVTVYTPAGVAVARIAADNDGNATIILPAAGLYVVSTPGATGKVLVK